VAWWLVQLIEEQWLQPLPLPWRRVVSVLAVLNFLLAIFLITLAALGGL